MDVVDAKNRVLSGSDMLLTISSFLIPQKTSDFKEFLCTVREKTLVLRKVSKPFKMNVYILLRRSIENFISPNNIRPSQYIQLINAWNKNDFLKALDVLEASFMYIDNMWPYANVSYCDARLIWRLDENDFQWFDVVFENNGFCSKYILSWVAMTCQMGGSKAIL